MRTVYKYPLLLEDTQEIEMPGGSQILTVQVQRDQPCVWALVETQSQLVNRTFRVAGTGHDIPYGPELDYIGTFQLQSGLLVFHVFEEKFAE